MRRWIGRQQLFEQSAEPNAVRLRARLRQQHEIVSIGLPNRFVGATSLSQECVVNVLTVDAQDPCRTRLKVQPRRIRNTAGLIRRRNQQPQVSARRLVRLVHVVNLLRQLLRSINKRRVQAKAVGSRRRDFSTGQISGDIRSTVNSQFNGGRPSLVGKISAGDTDGLLPVTALVAQLCNGSRENASSCVQIDRGHPAADGP